MGNFRADLVYGQLGEKFVSELGKDVSIEVKKDRLSLGTKNIFFEVECNGKPSGIMGTDASYWVHLIPKDDAILGGLLLEVKPLIKAIQSLLKGGMAISKDWSGDGGRVKGVIIPFGNIGELIKAMNNAS